MKLGIILLSLSLTGCIGNFKLDPHPGGSQQDCLRDGCIYVSS